MSDDLKLMDVVSNAVFAITDPDISDADFFAAVMEMRNTPGAWEKVRDIAAENLRNRGEL